MSLIRYTILLILGITAIDCVKAQISQQGKNDSLKNARVLPSGYLDKVSSKADKLEQKLDKKASRTLRKMKAEELKLMKRLYRLDSLTAKRLFSDVDEKYLELEKKLTSAAGNPGESGAGYIPYTDTLKTALHFLESKGTLLLHPGGDTKQKLTEAISKVNGLDLKMNQSEVIQQYLKERRQYLKEQLSKFSLDKYMKRMNKEVFYYAQAIKEYKSILKDKKKIEEKALSLLRRNSEFKKFMQRNSQWSPMFGIPSDGSPGTVPASFASLQTRASAQQLIQNSPVSSSNPQQFVSQQMKVANQQLSQKKNMVKLPDLDNLGEMPDFKINRQKSKPFIKRLEYGANLQFGRTNQFLPASSEVAVSLGYKLNDNGIIGVGSSYKLGLGSGIRHIRFSHQGYGMRSYVDWKIKGGFYLSGGYEKNYLPQLNDIISTQRPDIWQESGLIGILKKYPLNKKRKGSVQLLFDFLSYKNIPRSQPVIFRTGINL